MDSNLNSELPQKRYLLKVWYRGNNFAGSQRQPGKRTVENELIKVLKFTKYIKDEQLNHFRGAARTDAGVHARESVFGFTSSKPLYVRLIDCNLPEDMGIYSWTEIPLDFHPRFEVDWKEYRYIYPLPESIDLNYKIMQEALKKLEGEHDFALFAKSDPTKPTRLTKITMLRAKMETHSNYLVFKFRALFFLWQQIKRMVSFIIKIGKGMATLEDLDVRFDISNLNNPNFHRDKPVASEGLTLWKIHYNNLEFHSEPKCLNRMAEKLSKSANIARQQSESWQYLSEHAIKKKL